MSQQQHKNSVPACEQWLCKPQKDGEHINILSRLQISTVPQPLASLGAHNVESS